MYSTGLRVKETKEVYEGEVTELTPAETENPLSGYGKTISHVVVALKTVKGTKQLRLDPSIYESIQKERVTIGDVIYIEANTGAVKVPFFLFHFLSRLRQSSRLQHLANRFSDIYIYSELVDRMRTLRNSILRRRNTSRCRREKSTKRRRLFRTSRCTISTWRMRSLREVRTS